MSDDEQERWQALRRATDGITPSSGFAGRALAAAIDHPSGWGAAFAWMERRGLGLAGAGALACALLLVADLWGMRGLKELIMHTLVELPL